MAAAETGDRDTRGHPTEIWPGSAFLNGRLCLTSRQCTKPACHHFLVAAGDFHLDWPAARHCLVHKWFCGGLALCGGFFIPCKAAAQWGIEPV